MSFWINICAVPLSSGGGSCGVPCGECSLATSTVTFELASNRSWRGFSLGLAPHRKNVRVVFVFFISLGQDGGEEWVNEKRSEKGNPHGSETRLRVNRAWQCKTLKAGGTTGSLMFEVELEQTRKFHHLISPIRPLPAGLSDRLKGDKTLILFMILNRKTNRDFQG
jgi:hypothetical protein